MIDQDHILTGPMTATNRRRTTLYLYHNSPVLTQGSNVGTGLGLWLVVRVRVTSTPITW